MPAKNAVIFACDHNYIWPALLAANAVAEFASDLNFDIRIFSCTYVPDNFAEHAAPGVQAEVLPFGDFTVKTGVTERHSMATFLRLFAVQKILADYDRILYFDADMTVRHGDVGVFWDADLGGRPTAAVRDWINWGVVRRPNRDYLHGLGISEETGGYFNSGFLLIDAKEWRRLDLIGQILKFLDEEPELCRFHDQSALNYVMKGRWAEVSPLWNWQTKVLHHILLIETRNPYVVHFNARRKPWRDRDRMLGSEFAGPMQRIASKTDWTAFDDDHYAGPMRARREMIRAEELAQLYQTLPEYLETISPYLGRTDFVDVTASAQLASAP
ncbi:MAG: glycosyltransferase family 8 protein [Pseudomonadota bacterium]